MHQNSWSKRNITHDASPNALVGINGVCVYVLMSIGTATKGADVMGLYGDICYVIKAKTSCKIVIEKLKIFI